ncbi:hypothetical protein ACG7TL_006011 [Trametes sanguinea]
MVHTQQLLGYLQNLATRVQIGGQEGTAADNMAYPSADTCFIAAERSGMAVSPSSPHTSKSWSERVLHTLICWSGRPAWSGGFSAQGSRSVFYIGTNADTRLAGSQPQCITGVLNWHHGQYQLLDNGSIVLIPNGDGYQQIQDPCAAESNFIENYNDTELYSHWQIFMDQNDGPKLHIFNFDGSPVSPLFQIYNPPNMLPTTQLRNVTPSIDTGSSLLAMNNAGARSWSSPADVMALLSGVFAIGVASLLL